MDLKCRNCGSEDLEVKDTIREYNGCKIDEAYCNACGRVNSVRWEVTGISRGITTEFPNT